MSFFSLNHYGSVLFAWHPTLMSMAVFLILQEAIRAYSVPKYKARFTEIGGDWARYLSARSERKQLKRRTISGQFLSALALLFMIVGVSCVITSKHQLGLLAWPLSTHGICGVATLAALTLSVIRTLTMPICCPAAEFRSAGSCATQIISTLLFVFAYASAFLGVRELYVGHIWSGHTLFLFFILTAASIAIETLALCVSFLADRKEIARPRDVDGSFDTSCRQSSDSLGLLLPSPRRVRNSSAMMNIDDAMSLVDSRAHSIGELTPRSQYSPTVNSASEGGL